MLKTNLLLPITSGLLGFSTSCIEITLQKVIVQKMELLKEGFGLYCSGCVTWKKVADAAEKCFSRPSFLRFADNVAIVVHDISQELGPLYQRCSIELNACTLLLLDDTNVVVWTKSVSTSCGRGPGKKEYATLCIWVEVLGSCQRSCQRTWDRWPLRIHVLSTARNNDSFVSWKF